MGSHTLREKRKRVNQHQRAKDKKAAADSSASAEPAPAASGADAPLPECVRKLFASDYGEIEEGCSDVALFSLDPATHNLLLQLNVPQRLVQLLCVAPFDPHTMEALMASANSNDDSNNSSHAAVPNVAVHKGILFFQITAAQALRNMITNSEHDEAIDALEKASAASTGQQAQALLPAGAFVSALEASSTFHHTQMASSGSGATLTAADAAAALTRRLELCGVAQMDLASALVFLVAQTWELVGVARQYTSPSDLVAEMASATATEQAETNASEALEQIDGEALTEAQKAAIEHAMTQATNGVEGSAEHGTLGAMCGNGLHAASGSGHGRAPQRSSLYLTLLHYLDELLQLVCVCVEGNERVALYWSEPQMASWCVSLLQAAHGVVFENVQHTPSYYAALNASSMASGADRSEQQQEQQQQQQAELEAAHRFLRRRETHHCACLLVAGGDLLQTLSTDNIPLAAFLRGEAVGGGAAGQKRGSKPHATTTAVSLTPQQQAFLDAVVTGATAMEALTAIATESDTTLTALLNQTPDLTSAAVEQEEDVSQLRLEYHTVIYRLVQFTLALQCTLLNVASGPATVSQAMPLLVLTLQHTLPVNLWRRVALPLMSTQCVLPEPTRRIALAAVSQRLRCVHAAVRTLHTAVSWVCEQNDPNEEDEAAFANNAHASVLRQSQALYAFGGLLKDVLWMPTDAQLAAAAGSGDVMQAEQVKRDQHALRDGVAGAVNAEVSEVQFSVLATEVAVWSVASTLLMMVPATQLGDQPAVIWRAIVEAVQHRYGLLLDAAAAAAATAATMSSLPVTVEGEAQRGMVTHSPAARHMLWLQLESLFQMLWTLQRKQAKAHGGILESPNALEASAGDVDSLTRIAWESHASPALQQSSVGATMCVCGSLHAVDAITSAVRFALAMLSASTCPLVSAATTAITQPASLSQMASPWFAQSAPTDPTERHAWLAGLAALDGVVSVRCEAANALVDIFSDERYDAEVYVPLSVHAALQAFLPQARGYLKRRIQLTRDLQRHYRVVSEPVDAEQWSELIDNLEGFLDYKRQNVR